MVVIKKKQKNMCGKEKKINYITNIYHIKIENASVCEPFKYINRHDRDNLLNVDNTGQVL